jgi:energy-converting hydrogenase Eha subunit B
MTVRCCPDAAAGTIRNSTTYRCHAWALFVLVLVLMVSCPGNVHCASRTKPHVHNGTLQVRNRSHNTAEMVLVRIC